MAYSAEKKAEVIAALEAGLTAYEAAKKFRIPRATIAGWEKTLAILNSDKTDENRHYKKQKKDELIENLIAESLKEQFAAMIAIAKNAQDVEYIGKQESHNLAILFGVIADKSLQILRAAERRAELERKAREAGAVDSATHAVPGTAVNQNRS